MLDKEEIRSRATGHWIEIFQTLGGECIRDALENIGRHVDCPFHPADRNGEKDFRLGYEVDTYGRAYCTCDNFDGFEIILLSRDWPFHVVLQEISNLLDGISGHLGNSSSDNELRSGRPRDYEKIKDNINRILDECLSNHPRAIDYFRYRGVNIDNLPESILFHPELIYHGKDINNAIDYQPRLPALVCIYQDLGGEIVNILRIYLSNRNSGKAAVDTPKKAYRPLRPGATKMSAIRLDLISRCVALAEGVETAMAVRYATQWPVWATGDTNGMKHLELPKEIQSVLIWADNDKNMAGQKAASFLKSRLEKDGIKVVILLPDRGEDRRTRDWLDVLKEEGLGTIKKVVKPFESWLLS